MTNALVLVEKTDGTRKNYSLNLEATLKEIRVRLTDEGFMAQGDDFLISNAPIEQKDEEDVVLQNLWSDGDAKILHVGTSDTGLQAPDQTVDRYNKLNSNQKLALFSNLQIYQGITASASTGFTRTFKPCISAWQQSQLPAALIPNFMTQVIVESTFNEVSHSLTTSSVDKTSVTLSTPYGSGESGFEQAKSATTSSKQVTEYLTAKFMVNKVILDVDVANIQLLKDFEDQILAAARATQAIDQYDKLISVLNERGYYVPKRFTLGGSIMSTQTTKVSEYSQSETEKTEFSVGFKLAMDGFGGGGDYSHSEGKETSNSSTSKYSNLNLTKKGGQPEADEYADWAKSLNPAINWDVISYNQLYPTLALLSDKRLLRFCLNVLETYNTYSTVVDKQTVIGIGQYANQVEKILSISGTGIGG